MKRPSRTDYAYAVGRIRALERTLVCRPDFVEAADEKDFPSAVKVIYDAGDFPEEMIEIKDSEVLDAFLEKEESGLHELLSEILLEGEILTILQRETNPADVFTQAERLYYPFITGYIRHRIDLGNIKIFCRSKYLEFPKYMFESWVLRGGFLDENVWLDNYDLTFGELGEKLQASFYNQVWNRATDSLENKETFVILEREVENFLMTYLRRAKYIVFGPEPVFAYALAKKRELRLIRLIGVGKLNNIPPDTLKERMSETYV